jgi:hypothetical protein
MSNKINKFKFKKIEIINWNKYFLKAKFWIKI